MWLVLVSELRSTAAVARQPQRKCDGSLGSSVCGDLPEESAVT